MLKTFKLPPGAKPQVMILPDADGAPSLWQHELKKIEEIKKIQQQDCTIKDTCFEVSRQEKMKVGDLVEWAPTGVPSVWEVMGLDRWSDPADMNPLSIREAFKAPASTRDDAANEHGINPCGEVQLGPGVKAALRAVPRGKVRLRWFAGWEGYEGRCYPVLVKIEDVRELTPLEVLAICGA